MKKTLFSTCLVLLLASTTAWAQGVGKAEFNKDKHDFGKIQEDGGPAKVEFIVTNTGIAPITITEVQPSCGCTTPTWTKEPIQAGKTGIISASYDPMNRPGPFNKNITVKTNGEPSIANLTISGDVIPRKKGVKDWYPQESGSLRLTSRSVYFQRIYHDSKESQKLTLYNDSDKPVNIKLAETTSQLPAWATMTASKTTIAPKDSIHLNFTIDATKQNDWDYISTGLILKTDDAKEADKQLYLGGVVVENFGNLTAGSPTPQAIFDRITHDYGKINQGTTNTTTFVLTNKGQKTLTIRKVKASCGCTAPQPKKMVLEPGESTNVDVVYNSHGKEGKQNQTVTIITNDPQRAKQTLSISAEVLKTEAPKTEAPKTEIKQK
ncbi:MAG: DUF1573 domain-containing protein [Bacteroidetes bacterium]|nr:MAG: DUF1573 domain-containing protein [Bacteroidota bacterium]